MVASLLGIFNEREIATFLWLTVLVVVGLCKREIRESAIELVRILLEWQMLAIIAAMVMYVAVEVLILYKVGFWDADMVKQTAYWTTGSAFVLLVNSRGAFSDSKYIKGTVLSSLKLIAVIQFIVNLHVFRLGWELVMIPIVTCIGIMNVLSENREEYAGFHKVTTGILAIFGLVMVVISIAKILSDRETYVALDLVKRFMLPFLLMIGYMPFIYVFVVCSEYQLLFRRMDIFMGDDKEVSRYAKIQILRLCGASIWRLRRFEAANRNRLLRKNDKESIKAIVRELRDKRKQ